MRYACVLAMTLMLAASHKSFAGDASPVGRLDSPGIPYRGVQNQLINPGPKLESGPNGVALSGVTYRLLPSDREPAVAPESKSANNLVNIVRCPAGDSTNPDCNNLLRWKPLESATAYYRDVIIAAVTTVSGANDGETWSVTFTKPGGTTIDIGPVRFTSTNNCFSSSTWVVCGANSIQIFWYFSSQCTETGDWKVDALNNGSIFASQNFVVKPQLGTPAEIDAKLTPYSQKNYKDHLDSVCHSPGILDPSDIHTCSSGDDVPWTIAQLGCGITTFASMLSYFGVSVDPATLNKWFLDNKWYRKDGNLDIRAIPAYARSHGVEVSFVRVDEKPANLSTNICTYGPVPIRVKKNTHQVTATGRDDQLTTYTILDPWDGLNKTLKKYSNRFTQQYVYSGPEHHFEDPTGLNFTFHSPVEVFVVDPLGRRQGVDPRTGDIYNEIPNAYYGSFDLMGPLVDPDGPDPELTPDSPKVLDINTPMEGEYTLNVIGTDTGTYSADFTAYDINFDRSEAGVSDVPTALDVENVYKITFAKTAGSQIQVAGGFDGGGQRPRDVNRFLTYTSPTQASTSLPTGTSSYPLQVVYGATIIPSSFNATLNGADITPLFHPAPGTGEIVSITLQQGRNVLLLSIDGNLPNRVATDNDRLVFNVQ
jgi:hypothetical protein